MATLPVKSELVALRATPSRKALYREMAAREGMRLSEWLRSLAERRVREATTAMPSLEPDPPRPSRASSRRTRSAAPQSADAMSVG